MIALTLKNVKAILIKWMINALVYKNTNQQIFFGNFFFEYLFYWKYKKLKTNFVIS